MNKKKLIYVWILFLNLGISGYPLYSNQPYLKESFPNILGSQEVVLGNPKAPVVIICYSSFTCLHCAEFHLKVFPFLKQKYIDTGRAFYVMRDYPLDGISLKASQLARVEGVSHYMKNAEVFYARQKEWVMSKNPEKILGEIVKIGGASEEKIQDILKNKSVLKIILSQRLEAQKKLGVTHTPTFIINGRKVEGYIPFEKLEEYLEEAESC